MEKALLAPLRISYEDRHSLTRVIGAEIGFEGWETWPHTLRPYLQKSTWALYGPMAGKTTTVAVAVMGESVETGTADDGMPFVKLGCRRVIESV